MFTKAEHGLNWTQTPRTCVQEQIPSLERLVYSVTAWLGLDRPTVTVDAATEERGSRSNGHGDSIRLSPGLVSSVIICASLGSVPFSFAPLLRILPLSHSKLEYTLRLCLQFILISSQYSYLSNLTRLLYMLLPRQITEQTFQGIPCYLVLLFV